MKMSGDEVGEPERFKYLRSSEGRGHRERYET